MNKNNSISYLLGTDPTEYRTCKECGMTFSIKEEEKKWFLNRGMALPKRCRDCRAHRRQHKICKNIMGHSEKPLPTPFTLSSVDWKRDGATENYKRENAAELQFPARMTEDSLAVACTYCNSIDNPYAEELVRRTGNLDAFRTATDVKDRMAILQKSAKSFGITFI